MLEVLLLVIAVAFAFGADVFDVSETVKGIKAGLAVEANTFWVGTDKPSATQLYLRDGAVIALASALSVVALALHTLPLFYAGLSGPVIAGALHINGGRAWAKLLAGAKPTSAEKKGL
jgi:hypothetical protein